MTKVVGTTSYSVLPAGAVQSGFVGIQQVIIQSGQIISAESGAKTLTNAPVTITRESPPVLPLALLTFGAIETVLHQPTQQVINGQRPIYTNSAGFVYEIKDETECSIDVANKKMVCKQERQTPVVGGTNVATKTAIITQTGIPTPVATLVYDSADNTVKGVGGAAGRPNANWGWAIVLPLIVLFI